MILSGPARGTVERRPRPAPHAEAGGPEQRQWREQQRRLAGRAARGWGAGLGRGAEARG